MVVQKWRAAAMLALVICCMSFTAHGSDTGLLPVKDFARHPEILSPSLSPDGTHIAVRMDMPDGAHHALVVYNLADMSKPQSILRLPMYRVPLQFDWVSSTRLVVALGLQNGSIDKPRYTGEIIASDVDGKHQDYLYGYKNVGGRRQATRQVDRGYGFIDGSPEHANGHVYLSTQSFHLSDNNSHLYDVDAERNTRHMIGEINVAGQHFMVGADGQAHYTYGSNNDFDYVVYHQDNGRWNPLSAEQVGIGFTPITYTPDHQGIYAYYSVTGGPYELVSEAEDGSQREVLAKDDFGAIGNIMWTPIPSRPFATALDTGVPKVTYIDATLPAAKLYQALAKSFPEGFVDFINYSEDGKQLLFKVSSDRDPGSYYLIDTTHFKVRKLFSVEPWIDPTRMGQRRPLKFKASDGMELEAILTFPPGRAETDLPMVLLPHGGPHGISDTWYFDNLSQFLASRGYLVLQVNYRGSGGRGVNFREDGYLKWGTRIQQDLIDGVKWAIAQKYADADRVAVFGGSFGGYSALMSVIRAPKLFKCAIGYAGVYDLGMMYKKGDIKERKSGRSYLTRVIGKDDAALDANSPDKLADQIMVPVLLIHGEDDNRVPFAQAKAMRRALEAAHKPYEWLTRSGEGHGFYKEENNIAMLEKVQAFLETNIGKGAAPMAPHLRVVIPAQAGTQ